MASYWTVLCLTEIESRDHDFPYRIRMFAGASGGMVGAGYYVAQLGVRENREKGLGSYPAYQRNLLTAIAEDSLTPTVRCLALHDIPAFFCWWDQDWIAAERRGNLGEEYPLALSPRVCVTQARRRTGMEARAGCVADPRRAGSPLADQ